MDLCARTATMAGQRSEAPGLCVYEGLGRRGRDGHLLLRAGESHSIIGRLWD